MRALPLHAGGRIVQRVRELAERVRVTGRSLQLEPMNSYERRLCSQCF